MAVAAARVSDGDNVVGKWRSGVFDITLDNSYPTGGYSVAASIFGLSKVLGMKIIGGNAAAGILNFWYDTTNAKLIALCPTGGATAPTSLTAPVAAAPGVGTFAVTTTPDAGATTMTGSAAKPALLGVVTGALAAPALTAGQAKEMGNTADLSTLIVRAEVLGY